MANTYELPPRKEPIVKPKNGVVQPPVVPPANRPGRNTNKLEFFEKTLKLILKNKSSFPFHEPVNAKIHNIPDYHKKIKHPMDLQTIKKRLENRYYYNSSEAIDDFKLIATNCLEYNGPNAEVSKLAVKMNTSFETQLKKMPEGEEVEGVKEVEEIKKPRKGGKRKTVKFAPDVFIVDSSMQESATKTSTEATTAAETMPENPAGLSTESLAETTNGTRKSARTVKPHKKDGEKISDATSSSAETIHETPNESPNEQVAPKSRGRRNTIVPAKPRSNVEKEPPETAASAETISKTPTELQNEQVAPKPRGRRKTIAQAKSHPTGEKELPKELTAVTVTTKPKGRRKTIAPTNPHPNLEEELPDVVAPVETVSDRPTEPVTQPAKERRKPIKARAYNKKAKNSHDATLYAGNDRDTDELPGAVAYETNPMQMQIGAPENSGEQMTEEIFEAAAPTEDATTLQENVEISERMPFNAIDGSERVTEDLPSNENIGNSLNTAQNEVQSTRSHQRLQSTDSGVESIPDEGQNDRIRILEDQVRLLNEQLAEIRQATLKRITDFEAYSIGSTKLRTISRRALISYNFLFYFQVC